MVMIRYGNRDSVKVFSLFIKHFAPVVIEFGFWKFFYAGSCLPVVNITQAGYHGIFFRRCSVMVYIVFSFTATSNSCNM